MREQVFSAMSVVFEDVRFHRFTTIPEQNLEFTINIHELSGEFELSENGSTVVTGRIRAEDNPGEEFVELPPPLEDGGFLRMSAKDFYKELKLRGYQYSGQFRGVVECNVEATRSRVSWNDNWVAFLDNVMQIALLAADTRNLQLPTFIDRLVFDVDLHYAEIAKLNAEEAREKFIDVCYNHDLDIIRCGGVEVCGVQKAQILKKPSTVGPPAVQRYKFIPNFPENAMQLQDVINQHVQLVLENVKSLRIRCVEMVDEEYSKYSYLPVIENIKCALDVQPHVQSHLFIVSDQPVKVSPEIKVEKNKEAVENTLLYVGADLLRRNDELRQCAAMLKNEGFILSRERVLPDSDVDHDCCTIVSACKTGSEVLVLLRPKYEVSIGRCIKIELEDDSYSWMDEVKKCVGAGEKIILYARNDCYSGILGLVNCLKKEIGGNLIQCYVISGESAPEFDPKDSFYKPRINKDLMMNVFQNNQWGSYCHLPILDLDKTAPVAHAYVNVQTVGDLSSLRWVQGSLGSHIPENRDSEILNVMCSALNFRDVMTATGRLQADEVVRGRVNQDCVQGVEVCGRTANGSRVAAMARRGISNMVSLQNALVCAIPDEWSYEEGATVLVAYVTVYYAMIVIGKMKPGESILIHAGTGGVGQAAISLALHHGCEVFTTVGSAAKRALIKRLFPSLKDSHIGNSRDVSFEEMVTRETRGKGVDLVLNSLAEEKLVASVRCLGHRGRFLEIGRYDMSRNTAVELRSRRELAFYPVMLDYIFDDDSYDLRKELELLIVEGIATGAVRPLTACVFGKDEVEAAFRYMAAGRHVGKILIRIQEEESSPAGSALVEAVPRYICREERVYVLVGGLGGFGLELADWLVIRGARKLVIVSSRGVSNGYQASRLRLWRQYGARAEISTHDVSTEAGCEQVLRLANSMGPVDAIFNLAAKFIDFTFAKQTPDCFRTSLKSKAFATIHLDRVSRRLCPSLQKFVVFSSLACGHGNAGQTSYAFANSAMERVCERRRASGLHALAVQWGAVGDVGVVADMTEANRTYEIAGTVTQPIACCLDVLDKLLLRDEVIVSSFVVAEKAEGAADVETIVDTVAQIMGIKNLKSVSQQAALAELGIDSMISTELKQTLERQYGIFLSAHEIRNLTFAKLAEMNMKENATANGAEVLAASDKETTRIAWRSFGEEEMVRKPYVRLSNTHNECNAENVFLIPGIDGCSYNLEWLCRKLNAAVCILQPGLHLNDRLCDMVDRFYMTVKEQITPGRPFLLLGYSFGTVPVLELAAKLEQDGYEGQVCALDGSPVFSKAHLKAHIRTELQHHAVALVMNVVIPKLHDVRFVKEKLQVILSIDEKIDYLIDELKFKVGYSRDFLKSISTCIYERMLQLERLDADAMSRIRSPITLVRTHEVTVCSGARHDYSLGRFTSASVRVRSIVGDHYSILDSDECAAIINEMIKNVPSATTSK
ncbi:fatty acid synthase-like [Battus philenor]|uniref:fatty acid synthase-like n=1 Tax=Battus philenor TaxID=42288 RepID=UPI0035D1027F